jgi:hypothetical protein
LNGRDFTQLIALQPGFGGYSAGGFGSVNGTRGNQVNWQIDGVDNNDLWHNIPAVNQGGVSGIAGIVLPIDAIDEFSLQTQSSPEAGRNPGGVANHNFTALLFYNLPGRSTGPQWLLQGWQVSGLLSFHTGQPFTVFTETDNSGTNELVQRVNQVGDPFAGVSHKMVTANGTKFVQWVNPAAFAHPTLGTFGTMRRNQLYGPGFKDVDFSVLKNFRISERFNLQFRTEIFNLFNWANLAPPNTFNFAGPNAQNGFGQSITTIGDFVGAPGIGPGEPFNVQFALKLVF